MLAALSADRYYRLYTRNEDKLNKRPNSGYGFLMGSIGLHFCSIFLVFFLISHTCSKNYLLS